MGTEGMEITICHAENMPWIHIYQSHNEILEFVSLETRFLDLYFHKKMCDKILSNFPVVARRDLFF